MCRLSRTLISSGVSKANCVIERDAPVIKKEPLGHFYTPTPASTCEYTGKTAYGNEADLFSHLGLQQRPIEIHIGARNRQLKQADTSGDSPPLFLARAGRHVTDFATY
jgi:hypothetical protein